MIAVYVVVVLIGVMFGAISLLAPEGERQFMKIGTLYHQ